MCLRDSQRNKGHGCCLRVASKRIRHSNRCSPGWLHRRRYIRHVKHLMIVIILSHHYLYIPYFITVTDNRKNDTLAFDKDVPLGPLQAQSSIWVRSGMFEDERARSIHLPLPQLVVSSPLSIRELVATQIGLRPRCLC